MLGNDVEEDNAAANLPIKEVVKKNTSSKKSDVPPPSADPTKAKKKSKPTGNEGALKTKNSNKDVPPHNLLLPNTKRNLLTVTLEQERPIPIKRSNKVGVILNLENWKEKLKELKMLKLIW